MSTLPPLLRQHFESPQFTGRLAGANCRGKATNPACGDLLEIELIVEGGSIAGARFMAHGCSSLIAVSSLASEKLQKMPVGDARRFDVAALVDAAGGLPPTRAHAVAVFSRALAEALEGGAAQ